MTHYLTYFFSLPKGSKTLVIFAFVSMKHHQKLLSCRLDSFRMDAPTKSVSKLVMVLCVAIKELHVIIKTLLVFLQMEFFYIQLDCMVNWRLQNPSAFDAIRVLFRVQRGGYVSTLCQVAGTVFEDTERGNGISHYRDTKGLFTRYDFVACDKLKTGLRHELFRVNQTYNSLTTTKSCRRPVVNLTHATKSYRVNRPWHG